MVGQIRSYISYINVDSEDNYINRIRNMIENLDDVIVKTTLVQELNNKLKEIEIIRKYQKQKEVAKPIVNEPAPEYNQVETEEKIKSFEEEIEEKINEWKQYQENASSNEGTQKARPFEKLPDIIISAYNLVKIYTMHPKLLKDLAVSRKVAKVKVKTNSNSIPSIPIYND